MRSPALQYNPSPDPGGSSNYEGLILYVISQPDEDIGPNYSSAIAIVLAMKLKDQPAWYMDQWLTHVGFMRTKDQARQLLAAVGIDLEHVGQSLRERFHH